MSNRYARVPESVLLDQGLSPSDLKVYIVLAMHVFEGNIACIGQRKIAKMASMDRRNVRDCIEKLAKGGHISTSTVKFQRRSIYQLNHSLFRSGADLRVGVEIPPKLGVVVPPRIDTRHAARLVSFPRRRG